MKYDHIREGEWVQPTPQTGHKLACCDCGLVHTINFRVVRGKVQLQAFRDEKATKARRRNKKHIGQKLKLKN